MAACSELKVAASYMDSAYAKTFEHFVRKQQKSALEFLQMLFSTTTMLNGSVLMNGHYIELLSNNDGNFVSGTPGHWGLLTCF